MKWEFSKSFSMARPLRVDLAGAWYHVMNRGHRGETLFFNDADRRRFLGAVADAWSSWRVYMRAEANPGWLESAVVGSGCGGRSRAERRGALKAYTEQPIREGVLESPWEGLVGGIVLGERDYAQRLLKGRKVSEEEQTAARRMRKRVRWSELVRAAEKVKGEPWDGWAERHGDWTRDSMIYVARRHGGLRLAEVVAEMGIKYQAAAQAVKRFGQALPDDPERQRFVTALRSELSTI
jgi:hypothetical protein